MLHSRLLWSSNHQFASLRVVNILLTGRQLRQRNVVCLNNFSHKFLMRVRQPIMCRSEKVHRRGNLEIENDSLFRSEHCGNRGGNNSCWIVWVAFVDGSDALSLGTHTGLRSDHDRIVFVLRRRILRCLVLLILSQLMLFRWNVQSNRLPVRFRLCQIAPAHKKRADK